MQRFGRLSYSHPRTCEFFISNLLKHAVSLQGGVVVSLFNNDFLRPTFTILTVLFTALLLGKVLYVALHLTPKPSWNNKRAQPETDERPRQDKTRNANDRLNNGIIYETNIQQSLLFFRLPEFYTSLYLGCSIA